MIKRVGHWVFIVVGLAIAAWAIVGWLAPSTSCRGVEMGPGDTCSYSSTSEVGTDEIQTYEDRIKVAQEQAPFGVIAGLGMAAFGGVLAVRAKGAATSDRK
ncbi:MAG TPA: hypothetical protein K8V15_09100 [Tessaracoccus flavescens]|uniref:Uncharacterized protein n=1 Tax=Tessaracoccus flavescens TaxID=399497 RepID=A0A921ER20_9ACTN|nr:hypothetical protein [Tessaracoccus flavescens]